MPFLCQSSDTIDVYTGGSNDVFNTGASTGASIVCEELNLNLQLRMRTNCKLCRYIQYELQNHTAFT